MPPKKATLTLSPLAVRPLPEYSRKSGVRVGLPAGEIKRSNVLRSLATTTSHGSNDNKGSSGRQQKINCESEQWWNWDNRPLQNISTNQRNKPSLAPIAKTSSSKRDIQPSFSSSSSTRTNTLSPKSTRNRTIISPSCNQRFPPVQKRNNHEPTIARHNHTTNYNEERNRRQLLVRILQNQVPSLFS